MFGIAVMTAALALTPEWVLDKMEKLEPRSPWGYTFPETATAISEAANDMPLSTSPDGAHRTAAILIAIAYHESRFNPVVIGDGGKSFGLYQIQTGAAPGLVANALLLPRDASRVAISLIRTSFRVCGGMPWTEKLGWYASGGMTCGDRYHGREKSRVRMLLADRLLKGE